MARGIIISGASGGNKLVITNFDPLKKGDYIPGLEIGYVSGNTVAEGYLVEGIISRDLQSGLLVFNVATIVDSSPTVITGNTSGNITIGTGEAYYVKSTGKISGNVNVNGGVLFVSGGAANGNISIGSDSSIIGNSNAVIGGGTFQVTGGGSNAVVTFKSCTVNGKFSTSGITFVDLGGNNFNGHVESTNDKYVIIKDNTINGSKNLTVSNVINECNISNNTVSGTTTLDPACQP